MKRRVYGQHGAAVEEVLLRTVDQLVPSAEATH